jgi:glycosyltransferase involved in cell wall biosynthesis
VSFTPYDPPVRWPFLLVLDAQYRQTGWALLSGPIVTRAQQEQFVDLRRAGHRFVGMSSYLTFPHGCDGDPLDYEMVCDAWCHCFQVPERFMRTSLPRALISTSDFTDYEQILPPSVAVPEPGNRFDLIYVGATEAWKREAKNWPLAARAVPRLCRELDLGALVIGSPTDDFTPSARVTFHRELPWPVLLAHLARARFLFVPNVTDASPRIIAEALCLDVPILVNRDILGGWKYVNRFTGAFFVNEAGVTTAARAVCTASVAPRAWFRANYGPYQAGRRLLSLLRSVDPTLKERSYVRISEAVAEPVPAR